MNADVPVVHIELGSKLNMSAIKEGDDVYMECNIRAHPWVTKVIWKHNVIIPAQSNYRASRDSQTRPSLNLFDRSLISNPGRG